MAGPFIDLALPAKRSKYSFIHNLQKAKKEVVRFVEAASPGGWIVVGNIHASDNQLRDRLTLIVEVAEVRDITADFMTALARLRLVGRPGPTDAANVILALLAELLRRIPPPANQPLHARALSRFRKTQGNDPSKVFNNCLAALGEANDQFISIIRPDHLIRQHSWQIWRPKTIQIRSAKELLGETGAAILTEASSLVSPPDNRRT